MKILMIHQHFKTPQGGGAVRSYYLAKALVDRGHRVVMITAFNGKLQKTENVEGIEVHSLPIDYNNRFKFYARGWAFVRFIIGASRLAGKFKDFDRCYGISVPLTVGVIAIWIKIRYDIRYIFEVGDLWPDAPIQMGFVRNYFFQRSLFALERLIYKQAESLVALSPAIQSAIEMKAPGKKIHLVPNMADCDFYHPEQKKTNLEIKFGVTGKFVVSYIGAIGVANGLDYFLECAEAVGKTDLPVHFILCGDGALLQNLRSMAEKLDLRNFSFVDFVNRDGVKEIMNVSDAVFVCYKPAPILETGSPNKYFDGLAAGKLIIINFGGWIKREIEDNRCGISVDPRQPIDFAKKISPFVTDPRMLVEFKTGARGLGEKEYSRKLLSETFAKLFS